MNPFWAPPPHIWGAVMKEYSVPFTVLDAHLICPSFFSMVHNFNLAWHTSTVCLWAFEFWNKVYLFLMGVQDVMPHLIWSMYDSSHQIRTSFQVMMLIISLYFIIFFFWIKVVHKLYKGSRRWMYSKIVPVYYRWN